MDSEVFSSSDLVTYCERKDQSGANEAILGVDSAFFTYLIVFCWN